MLKNIDIRITVNNRLVFMIDVRMLILLALIPLFNGNFYYKEVIRLLNKLIE